MELPATKLEYELCVSDKLNFCNDLSNLLYYLFAKFNVGILIWAFKFYINLLFTVNNAEKKHEDIVKMVTNEYIIVEIGQKNEYQRK